MTEEQNAHDIVQLTKEVEKNGQRYHKVAGEISSLNLLLAGELAEMKLMLAKDVQIPLAKIEGHLDRLNGSVARHETGISELEKHKASQVEAEHHDQRLNALEATLTEMRGATKTFRLIGTSFAFALLAIELFRTFT